MHWWELLRSRSAFGRLLRDLDPALVLTLVDVGSIGGLKDRWQLLQGRVRSYGFDPREKVERQEANSTILPYAVGRETGVADFYVTRFGNMSSMLRPNPDALYCFQDREYKAEVVEVEQLPIRRIDDSVPGPLADALKVDAQGGEMEILLGAQGLLRSGLLLAEVEVSFIERYIGQPMFGDIDAFMRERGFDLLDLYQLRRYYRTNSLMLRKHQVIPDSCSGQLSYADAVFFLSDAAIAMQLARLDEASASVWVVKAILLLLIYGKFDRALQLFDQRRSCLFASEGKVLAAFFATLPRSTRPTAAERDHQVRS